MTKRIDPALLTPVIGTRTRRRSTFHAGRDNAASWATRRA